jgi:hypothetical protein
MAPWLRNTLAVLAALLVYVAIWIFGGWLCSRLLDVHADRPGMAYFVSSLIYLTVAAVIAGYVVAVLGKRNPVSHGVGLAMVMLGINIVNLVTKYESPHLTYVLLVNIGVPLMAIFGSFLRRSHTE